MNFDIQIPNSPNFFAEIEGTWEKKTYWDWNGTITAKEPIVAISIMRVGNHVEWARSQKTQTTKLDIRLLLGTYDSNAKDVLAMFSIGNNGPRLRTLLDDPNQPPEILTSSNVPIGKPFIFSKPFGNPELELFGLIILREQVVSARNGLWHIKEAYKELLPAEWFHILAYGRAGQFEIEN